jgi:hypothetical protein
VAKLNHRPASMTIVGLRIKEFALSTICLDVPCRQSKMPDNGTTRLSTFHLTMGVPYISVLQTITIPCGLRSSLLSKVRADVLDAQQLLIRATSVDNRWPDRVLTVCVRFLHWQWIWTGGIRVPQFISGGWIDQQLPAVRKAQSNTYIFPNDIAPTLLEMAGGDVSFLLGKNAGAPYGSPMWEYIKNSIDPTKSLSTHQRVRKVAYTHDMFFDVREDRTMKFFYTGNNPILTPRLYEPVWPRTGDLYMDTLYNSVKPCRPNGVASDCCSLNIELDWQEKSPLSADCQAMLREAQNLFAIEGGCPKDSQGRNTNPICLEEGDINSTFPKDLSLWTHYGAAGPFTNSKGRPLNDLPMKCACYGLTGGASASSDVDYFIVRNFGPSQCGNSRRILSLRPPQSIPCDGSFAFDSPPQVDIIDQYKDVGFSIRPFKRTLLLEQEKLSAIDLPVIIKTMLSYMTRQGHTDWPAINKFPFNVYMDTCKAKGVVPVPFPILSITPYQWGARDPTLPFKELLPRIGLCSPVTLTHYFCPSHQNAQLKPVVEWHFGPLDPHGVFADGTRWEPMGIIECSINCKVTPKGTAYIGDGPHGVVV